MINVVWLLLIVAGVATASLHGQADILTRAAMDAPGQAVETILGLVGVMSLWLGIMKIAERARLVDAMARLMTPVTRRIFPSVPPDHPAMGAIMMNLSANLLGVGGAATPMGLRAMEELQKLNPNPDEATPAMCTFLALNTTGLTLVPATVVALRALAGSANPAEVVLPTLIATAVSTTVALVADAAMRAWWPRWKGISA